MQSSEQSTSTCSWPLSWLWGHSLHARGEIGCIALLVAQVQFHFYINTCDHTALHFHATSPGSHRNKGEFRACRQSPSYYEFFFLQGQAHLHSHLCPTWDLSSSPPSHTPHGCIFPASANPSTEQSTHPNQPGDAEVCTHTSQLRPSWAQNTLEFSVSFFPHFFWKISPETDKEDAFLPPRKNENYNPIYIAKDTLLQGAEQEGWKKCKLTQKLWATVDVARSLVWDQDAILSYFFLLFYFEALDRYSNHIAGKAGKQSFQDLQIHTTALRWGILSHGQGWRSSTIELVRTGRVY